MHALLALEDGHVFCGRSFGDPAEIGGEVIFTTAMTGYQEVLTDPSYRGQIVVFTAAHIGNYGIHRGHGESARPWAAGVIVRDLADFPSHSESVESLRRFVRQNGMFGMMDVDTRLLTLHLRKHGALRGICTSQVVDPDEAVNRARQVPNMSERRLVEDVTVAQAVVRKNGKSHRSPRVAVLDYGVKESILSLLERAGCEIVVLPADASACDVDAVSPEGIVLSNGPGDPETLLPLLGTVRHCIDRYPTLAICLGHQLVGLALGAKIRKLRFGHHGANHPVQDLRTGTVQITAQNHNYVVDPESLPPDVEVTHINLNDGTVEGLRHRELRLWSYQFHPEGAPGPHDALGIFDEFASAIGREGGSDAAQS